MTHCTIFHDCLLAGKTILKSRQYLEYNLSFFIAKAFPIMWLRHIFSSLFFH